MSKFSSNCTLPETVINYVSSPNTRGTIDILWTCLTTVFLCTWSVQHLNVPAIRSAPGQHLKRASMFKQTGMMIFTIFAPEFLLLKAIVEFASAAALTEKMTPRAREDGASWSRVHSFFTNMGGFVIVFGEDASGPRFENTSPPASILPIANGAQHHDEGQQDVVDQCRPEQTDCEKGLASTTISNATTRPESTTQNVETTKPPHLKERLCRMIEIREKKLPPMSDKNSILVGQIIAEHKAHLFAGHDEGFTLTEFIDHVFNLIRLRGTYWALDGPQLLLACEMGIISKIPNIPTSDIEDKSSGDFLVKFLAVIQASWQIIQLILRWAQHLPTSQFEIATMGFALTAFCTYILYWSKPQDVKTPIFVKAERYPTLEEIKDLANRGPSHLAGVFTGHEYSIPEHGLHSHFGETRQALEGGILGWFGSFICATLFGLVHCVAWSFHFPTPVERLLWRISAMVTTVLPVMYAVRGLCLFVADRRRARKRVTKDVRRSFFSADNPLIPSIGAVLAVLYVVSRLYLLIEVFRSLLFLAPGTFQTAF